MISSDLRFPIGLACIAVAVLAIAILSLRHIAHNRQRALAGQPLKSVGQHVRTHAGHHLGAGAVAGVGAAVLLGAGVAIIAHGFGARFNRQLHVAAPPALAQLGRTGPPVSPDLERYLPPVYDQGATAACGPHSLVEAIYAQVLEQTGRPPVLSPWQNYYYAAGNSSAGTSIDQDTRAATAHGVETLAGWPTIGGPDGTDPAHTTGLPRASYQTLFYQPQGWNGLYAVEAELNAGYVVILLHQVHDGEYNAFGVSTTDNQGSPRGYHFAVAYKHVGDVIYIRNSWGSGFGIGGDVGFTPAAFLNTVEAAYIIHVGVPAAWRPPAPSPTTVPLPTARPRSTSTPRPRPTATPRPRPTQTPRPVARVIGRSTNLREAPALHASILEGLPAGTHVEDLGQHSPPWAHVRVAVRTGWVLTATLR